MMRMMGEEFGREGMHDESVQDEKMKMIATDWIEEIEVYKSKLVKGY